MAAKFIALMGSYGTGKSLMAASTAVRRPVHILDIDRKVKAMSLINHLLEKSDVTYKEIGDTVNEGGLLGRLDALSKNEAVKRAPLGWTNFAKAVQNFETDEDVKKAGTIVIDTYTQLAVHMKAHMQFLTGKPKLVWDNWSAWKQMWTELTTILIDYCIQADKDLIVNIHERISEKPGEGTTKVIVSKGEGGRERTYTGTQDVKIAGSIEGAFGLEFGSFFTDVYHLKVNLDSSKNPVWRCRVLPDGQRDLRCSFDVKGVAEWEPDFRKIWGLKK